MSATCWLWFASCQWGIPISLRPPLPFIFLFTIHLTTYRGGRILVISCWIGNLTRSLTSNGDSDPRAFQLTASRGGWRRKRGKGIWNMKFQLTASRGGWRCVLATDAWCIAFQLTASRGGWQQNGLDREFPLTFQLTASRGGWPLLPQDPDPWNIISTHSLTRRLTPSTARCMNEYKNFNSQPHEEADVPDLMFCTALDTFQLTASRGGWRIFREVIPIPVVISTHSLTRRLTSLSGDSNMS